MPNVSSRTRILLAEILFFLLILASCRPLWLTDWLPLQDLPQHLAAIRVLHDFSQPELGFQSWFELTPMSTQYIGFYLLASLLSFIFEVETATRILIVASVASVPYAMRFLLRALKRPQWLALFVIPLAYNTNFILGFLNFNAAIPLMLVGLGLAVLLREEVRKKRIALYAVAASACYLMHVLPFAILVAGTVMMAVSSDWRVFAKRLMPLVPVAIVAGIWSMLSPAGGSIRAILRNSVLRLVSTPDAPASFMGWDKSLRQIPDWLLDMVNAPGEDMVAIALAALVGLSFLMGSAQRLRATSTHDERAEETPSAVRIWAGEHWPHFCLVALVMLAWSLYFFLPQGYDWVWPIASRFALIGVILTVPLIPQISQRGLRYAMMLGLALVIIAQASIVGRSFEAFQNEEVADFGKALDAIPEGQRVAGLIYERGSKFVRFAPFIHSVARVQSRKGGAVMFSFADFPQSPFRFRADNRPPEVAPRWEWTPQKVDPRSDLAWYNYVLVRGGPGKIQTQPDSFQRVYDGQRWSVWKRASAP